MMRKLDEQQEKRLNLVRRLFQFVMDEDGLSRKEVSRGSGHSENTFGPFMSGKAKRPGALFNYGEFLGVDVGAALRGELDDLQDASEEEISRARDRFLREKPRRQEQARGRSPEPRKEISRAAQANEAAHVPARRVPIVGVVEAGAFRPVDWFAEADLGEVVVDSVPGSGRAFAFKVAGDSMDLAGIGPDSTVVCLDPWSENLELGDGDVVVVERTINGGHTRELTCKELVIGDNGPELHPRSSNPRHKPLRFPGDADLSSETGPEHEVRIVGLVIQTVTRQPPRRPGRKLLGHPP